ncbi:MAG TPA: HAMP domain-containing sensor histidine kinase, partial [Opitutaceae bacterium]|nr:HAMP domain-containing sensor histidine kinase [Opitutaceae bacterium]
LEAGQEQREISEFDVANLVRDLCTTTRPLATDRKLYLETSGPERLHVQGDAGRVRRLLQNLLFNAIKYTERGGVTVSWGEQKESWWVAVKDTGPGLMAGPGAPLVAGLKEATASARETDKIAASLTGEATTVLPIPPGGSLPSKRPDTQQAGEGIGLSIVKRLCELLDASLELSSSAETGTTFRVVFPARYSAPGSVPAGSPA